MFGNMEIVVLAFLNSSYRHSMMMEECAYNPLPQNQVQNNYLTWYIFYTSYHFMAGAITFPSNISTTPPI